MNIHSKIVICMCVYVTITDVQFKKIYNLNSQQTYYIMFHKTLLLPLLRRTDQPASFQHD